MSGGSLTPGILTFIQIIQYSRFTGGSRRGLLVVLIIFGVLGVVREVVPVEVPAQKNKIDKYLDFRPKCTGQINSHSLSDMQLGSLPNIVTNDHATNSIIRFYAKMWLPNKMISNKYTPKKSLPFIERMVKAGILQLTKIEPKNLIMMFPVPKSDPNNPRMIMDFKPFTKETKSPPFKLPNIKKIIKTAGPQDYMIKLDLTNGFFHIHLHPKTRGLFGIKCQNKYYVINKLPQGLSVSPYIMQRVTNSILQTMLKHINVKILIYLDDILLVGTPKDLESAKLVLLASSFLFNEEKCELQPTKKLTYLGIVID